MSHCFYISQNLTNIRKDHWSPLVFVLSRTFRPGAVVHYLVQDIYIWEKSLWDVWKVQHWWGLCIAMLHTSVPFPFHLRCWQLPLARMQAVQRALKCRICMILPQRFPPREAEKESIHRDSTGCAMFCHVLPVVGSKDQTILHDLPVFCSMFWNSFGILETSWNILKHGVYTFRDFRILRVDCSGKVSWNRPLPRWTAALPPPWREHGKRRGCGYETLRSGADSTYMHIYILYLPI